jgi:PleD family two-component response regulator
MKTEVSIVAERVRKLVHSSGISWWGDILHVTVSVGATTVHSNDSVESIIGRAEHALRETARLPGKCIVVVNKA